MTDLPKAPREISIVQEQKALFDYRVKNGKFILYNSKAGEISKTQFEGDLETSLTFPLIITNIFPGRIKTLEVVAKDRDSENRLMIFYSGDGISKQNAFDLLEKARLQQMITGPDKKYCEMVELIILLDAGALPLRLNSEMVSGKYLHEVRFYGQIFTTATADRVWRLDSYKT